MNPYTDQIFNMAKAIGMLQYELESLEKFCTWLCEDSKKYPGTDAGNVARHHREDIRKALRMSKEAIGVKP